MSVPAGGGEAGDAAGVFADATARDPESEDSGPDKPRYRRYQFTRLAPYCGASVCEVGAGLGEFSGQLTGRDRIVATDADPEAVEAMEKRFAARPEMEVTWLDLHGPVRLDRPVETVVAINVLEHVTDDVTVLVRLASLLVPGGTVVVWVPGYQHLYGQFDRRVGHVRRYSPATLTTAMRQAGMEVQVARPVNPLGALAWWAAVRRGGASTPTSKLARIYDRLLVPASAAWERVLPAPFGQSVLGVARHHPRNDAAESYQ